MCVCVCVCVCVISNFIKQKCIIFRYALYLREAHGHTFLKFFIITTHDKSNKTELLSFNF